MPAPRYLGDAVYVAYNATDDFITLTTNSHKREQAMDVIYLERSTWKSLVAFIEETEKSDVAD